MAGKELLLVVPTWPPGEHIANRQSFATRVTNHRFRRNTFGWDLIVGASPSMYMGVTGIPTPFRRIDPTIELYVDTVMAGIDRDRLDAAQVFRAAGAFHLIFAVGEPHRLTIRAIDLRLKKQVGRQPHCLWRIGMAELV